MKLYSVTVVIHRSSHRTPAGTTHVEVTSEVEAENWNVAVYQATDNILESLVPLTGGTGCQIVSVKAESA
jgi:hypothetical protein